jgi:putative transposase
MSAHKKAYRFRMRPTAEQAHAMNRMAGCRRYVWNWGLARHQEYYKATGKTLPMSVLSAELTELKKQPGMEWLAEADSQALQQALTDLYRAFDNFFNPDMKAGFPRFKGRKRDRARFRIPQRVKLVEGAVIVPKIEDPIRIRQSQPVDLPTKSATFKRDAKGRWFVTLVAEFEMPDVAIPLPTLAQTVGIDVGLIDYATFSDDTPSVPAPKFYRRRERKTRRAQRKASRCQKGSKRRAKANHKVATIHQKTACQRGDFQHKLSTKVVSGHDAVCTEDLSLSGLARTKLAKSFADAGLGEFKRQLEYKCLWYRRHFVMVGRFFPSSKMCHVCGANNQGLTMSDRHWVCECGAVHDRDKNAAYNIRNEGHRILAAGHAESLNARGDRVRPSKRGQ